MTSEADRALALLFADLAQKFGLSRPAGQCFAAIWRAAMTPSADDLTQICGLSRSGVSVALKELRAWGMIEVARSPGNRREFFTAPFDPWELARRIIDWPLDKPATVFGGLTFGGGPIGNYMSHAVASMVDQLRAQLPQDDQAYVWGQIATSAARRHLPESLGGFREARDAPSAAPRRRISATERACASGSHSTICD